VFTTATTGISGSTSVSFTLVTDAGRANAYWHLKKSSGGNASCSELGIEQVRLDMIPTSGPTLTKTAPCTGYPAYKVETDLMLAGSYRLVLTIPSATETRTVTVDPVEVPPGRAVSVGPLEVVF
jgi:hypothetical protein